MKGRANMYRAEAALELRRYDEAAKEAGLAIAADPENAHAYFVLARVLSAQKQPRRALTTLDIALQKRPNVPLYHASRSDILRALIEYQAAMESAQECLRLEPDSSMGHVAVGLCARELDDRKGSVEAFEHALALDPHDPQTMRLLGDAHLALKDYAAAEKQYRAALHLNPNDAVALNNLGCALKARRKLHDATLAFKAALLLDPTLQQAKENTHASMQSLIGRAGPVGLLAGAGALVKVGFAALVKAPAFFAIAALHLRNAAVWAGAAGLAFVVFVVALVRQRLNRARLQRADPQLMHIYEQLDADKKLGRF